MCVVPTSGIETPTADELLRLERNVPGKKLSNEKRESPIDRDARMARTKGGCSRSA